MFLVVEYYNNRKEVFFSVIKEFQDFDSANVAALNLAEENFGKEDVVNFVNEYNDHVSVYNTLVFYTAIGCGNTFAVVIPDSMESKVIVSKRESRLSLKEKYTLLMEKAFVLERAQPPSFDKWVEEDYPEKNFDNLVYEEKINELESYFMEWQNVDYKELEWWLDESSVVVEMIE